MDGACGDKAVAGTTKSTISPTHEGEKEGCGTVIVIGDDADGIPSFLELAKEGLLDGEIHRPQFFCQQSLAVLHTLVVSSDCFDGIDAVAETVE